MPYIDFGGGSKQTPVKKQDNCSTCDNCIHRYIINKDLFYCTVNGTIQFYNTKYNYDCLFKNTVVKNRKLVIAIYHIKDDGVLAWIGYTSIFLSSAEKTDNDVVKLFYEKAVPDIYKKEPKVKDLFIVPIIVAEAIEHEYFKPIGNIMPFYILSDIVKNLNLNINNLGAITDE